MLQPIQISINLRNPLPNTGKLRRLGVPKPPDHLLDPPLILLKCLFEHLQKLIPEPIMLLHERLLDLPLIRLHECTQRILLIGQPPANLL